MGAARKYQTLVFHFWGALTRSVRRLRGRDGRGPRGGHRKDRRQESQHPGKYLSLSRHWPDQADRSAVWQHWQLVDLIYLRSDLITMLSVLKRYNLKYARHACTPPILPDGEPKIIAVGGQPLRYAFSRFRRVLRDVPCRVAAARGMLSHPINAVMALGQLTFGFPLHLPSL